MGVPERLEIRREVGTLEPLLTRNARAVIVRLVDELVRDRQLDGQLTGKRKVAAPPVPVVRLVLDALHEDQPIRVRLEHRVTRALGGGPPVRSRVAVTPGGRSVRLVVEVRADHGWVAAVAAGEHHPVVDPALLADLVRIPQLGLRRGGWAMSVEDDFEAALTSALDHLIHDLQPAEALQIGVLLKIDPVWRAAGFEQLVAVGQTDGIEA